MIIRHMLQRLASLQRRQFLLLFNQPGLERADFSGVGSGFHDADHGAPPCGVKRNYLVTTGLKPICRNSPMNRYPIRW